MKVIICILFIYSSILSARVDNIFDGLTKLEKPFSLRDPFQSPKFKSERNKKSVQRASGVLDNIPKLESDFSLERLKITGVLIGKERRVFINSGGKSNFSLKEGDSFGRGGPEIKAIMPGGVILVEKIKNIDVEDEFI